MDSASGEPLLPAAEEMLRRAASFAYADPRRLHSEGRQARALLDNARAAIAEALGVEPSEVSFVASGTEAVHRGLAGLLTGAAGLSVSAAAHSAVLAAAREWEARGTELTVLPVDRTGRTSPPTRASDVVAIAVGNHEVGTLEDNEWLTEHRGPVFVDACASGGRLPLPQRWDVAALSAHKWGGPAGVGVLVVRRLAAWRHVGVTDDRVDHRSTGFENIAAAMAAAAALQETVAARDALNARHHRLCADLRARLARLPDVEVHGDPEHRLPHIVGFSCLLVSGDELVSELDRAGFAVSSGSACTTSTLEPSHVLVAMGALTHGNLRVSLSRDTTAEDLDAFAEVLEGVLQRLREGL